MKKFILMSAILFIAAFSQSFITKQNDLNENFLFEEGEYGQTVQYSVHNFELSSGYGCDYWVSMTITISNGFGFRYRTLTSWINLGDTWNFPISLAKNEIIVHESVHIKGSWIDETLPDANTFDFWGGESCNANGNTNIGTSWNYLSGKSYEVGENVQVLAK